MILQTEQRKKSNTSISKEGVLKTKQKKKLAENMQFALKSSYKLKRTQSSWKE